MKLALICPTSMLDTFANQSEGVHLCLVQEALKDDKYADFYRERSQKYNDLVILDNGTFEQGHPCSTEEIMEAAKRVDADVVVAPDFPGEHCDNTFKASAEFAEEFFAAQEDDEADIDLMIVPQSKKGDVEDWLRGTMALMCEEMSSELGPLAKYIDRISMVGISILSCPNAFGSLVGDDEPEICRFTAFQFLRQALSDRDDVRKDKRIHCLGAGARLDLISYYGMAYSLDTSSPVWHGWHGIHYTNGFLPEGKMKTPVDFQAPQPSEIHFGGIQNNIMALKAAARAADVRHG